MLLKKTKMQKAQIFSLDFVIAAAIVVLAIGMIINFYEMNSIQQKDARIKDELALIAANSASVLLEQNRCTLEATFAGQGYKAYGCADSARFAATSKSELMIPNGFNCYISVEGVPANNDCDTDVSGTPQDVASVEREFIDVSGTLSKSDYEKCNTGGPCNFDGQDKKMLSVKIWRQ